VSALFTERQLSVARLVLRGWTNREIASELSITPQRVQQVVAAVARKLPGPGSSRRRIREHLTSVASGRAA
jgi:DNA-binding CsgD family transcriptional regulator